jgi:predicted site-specific integrase-resolvase
MEPVAYRISEFCQTYVISRTALYREIKAGRLRLLKRGKRSLIERAEAERWFDTLRNPPALKPTARMEE